jgi:hypothetical protein
MRELFSKKMSEAASPASGAGVANQPFFLHYFLNFGGGDFSFNVFEKGLVCNVKKVNVKSLHTFPIFN